MEAKFDLAVLASRIHTPGCPWSWTSECEEKFAELRQVDEEAANLLIALARRARQRGLPPTENNYNPQRRHVSHRCPVGGWVKDLPDQQFSDARPMPWTGELYAESHDGRTLYRLYFIERRPHWVQPTDEIIGSGIGQKPVDETTGWTSETQTLEIHDAMVWGVTRCENLRSRWRRWNTA